ncbi:cytochrome c3 family protein [Pelovirga terrestris]|uniref:Doubled CXXCH motif domain-containing protein n=1 Tax=Pelovirga terrestris TaxID=2771352 RepID=A0A8J6QXU1_9BACT|nr:cytochrome c3 family protein [Pelovirga terrestris]MBD1401091.1 hypothetical protein [Pelovirga terrestris]
MRIDVKVLLIVMLLLPLQVAALELEVLTPPSGSSVMARHAVTHLVVRQTGSERMVRIQLGNSAQLIDPVVTRKAAAGKGIYQHYRLPLVAGSNNFTLVPGGNKININFQPIQSEIHLRTRGRDFYFFHAEGELPPSCNDCHTLADPGKTTKLGLPRQESCLTCHRDMIERSTWRHSASYNQQCLACHQQSLDPWRIGMPQLRIRDLCLECHTGKQSWLNKKHVHGPINLGSCTLCHDPHGGTNPRRLWADGDADLCISCHSNMLELTKDRHRRSIPYVHGLITGPGCIGCHDPHASDHLFVLHSSINDLCSSCHPGPAQSGAHPVERHPLHGPKELLRPGRELSCTSCHEAHGSHYRHLLIQTTQGGRLCRECHEQ